MQSQTLFEILECTYPTAELNHMAPWCLRRGEAGGQRVSATRIFAHLGQKALT